MRTTFGRKNIVDFCFLIRIPEKLRVLLVGKLICAEVLIVLAILLFVTALWISVCYSGWTVRYDLFVTGYVMRLRNDYTSGESKVLQFRENHNSETLGGLILQSFSVVTMSFEVPELMYLFFSPSKVPLRDALNPLESHTDQLCQDWIR